MNKSKSLTRRQALKYRKMFETISEVELNETRKASPLEKLIQHVALMSASSFFPKESKIRSEALPVMKRWLMIEERMIG